jgi:double-strand break repair protein MRE11
MKLLLATDNHVGYLERDPIRGKDSFRAFEEILQIANEKKVDMILLGGDLFHDNKPSRYCMYTIMQQIRHYCMGSSDSDLMLVSDPNFQRSHTVNYLDPNYNVKIPIFSIHGNHDDPSGVALFHPGWQLVRSGPFISRWFG